MALTEIEGRTYGPFAYTVDGSKIDEFVSATSDDPDRWRGVAPPGFGASLLFAAAPSFFADPTVGPYTSILLHTDQHFTWRAPIRSGDVLSVAGTIDTVRERAGLNMVTFIVEAQRNSDTVLASVSTFMMSDATPAAETVEETEPPHDARGPNEVPRSAELPADGDPLPRLAKSASRSDLVRYAGATGDFNPLHWDHAAARAAGMPGVVVHGLLMASWFAQSAARFAGGPSPLNELRVRFRRPLRPGVAAVITGDVVEREGPRARIKGSVSAGDAELVVGGATIRLDG
ncbi:MAG: MaoC family dehydratase N-terminal domain-containing protein [Acidimicrobiia bacterium]|nr:MaoC family dehydratase N-terminal domain-containing protein [Acidimicrobiia bacterium]